MRDVGSGQSHPIRIDDVDVGPSAGGEHAAIAESVDARRFARELSHDQLEWQARTTLAIAHPVRQHERGITSIADEAHVRAAVAQADHGVGPLQQRVRVVEIRESVVAQSKQDHRATVVGQKRVVQQCDRIDTGRLRARRDALRRLGLVVEIGTKGVREFEHRGDVIGQRDIGLARWLGQDADTPLWIAQFHHARGEWKVRDCVVARSTLEWLTPLEAEQGAHRPTRDLGYETCAGGVGVVDDADEFGPRVRTAKTEQDRSARVARQSSHPLEFGAPMVEGGRVHRGTGDHLEYRASAGALSHRVRDREQLGLFGVRTGNDSAIDGTMTG